MSDETHLIPIWFFIGITLLIYGVLIFGAGIYGIYHPPEHQVAMAGLNAGIWWGALLALLGAIYAIRSCPRPPGSGK